MIGSLQGHQGSETTQTGQSRFHISTPWGSEPGSLVTGSKRVVHWTSETLWEWSEIAGSPHCYICGTVPFNQVYKYIYFTEPINQVSSYVYSTVPVTQVYIYIYSTAPIPSLHLYLNYSTTQQSLQLYLQHSTIQVSLSSIDKHYQIMNSIKCMCNSC